MPPEEGTLGKEQPHNQICPTELLREVSGGQKVLSILQDLGVGSRVL